MPRNISRKNETYIYGGGEKILVVLNGDNGAGVDIFITLERADGSGYILILDQRKRQSADVTQSNLSTLMSKVPQPPMFFGQDNLKLETVFGLMNVYSNIKVHPVPDSVFFVSNSDSLLFHGSLFDHPGCSAAIDVNTGLVTSIQQLFRGTGAKRKELTGRIIEFRRKRTKIESYEELVKIVSEWGGALNEWALARVTF
ncbi:hypothetical protein HDU76_009519 [Blyttiomyces sp. JEL0837]|nr:hypothetical protein HDU76_009519 [Blyttiomyces sp. JEL0837]